MPGGDERTNLIKSST